MEQVISHKTSIALIIFGLLTLIFIIATLFTSLTERELTISSTTPVALGTPEFRTTVESITRSPALPLDSDVTIFADGRVFLADLMKEMEGAKNSITITNYIFHEGEMADTVFTTLAAAAQRGVAVHLLLDAQGASKANETLIEKMKDAGVKVETFRPRSFRALTRIHRRSHVRAIVIDGLVGYTGGLAFEDAWLGDGMSAEKWRDLMFKYDGSLARATQDTFGSLWRQTGGEILTGPAFYPSLPIPDTPKKHEGYFISLLHTPAPDISADLLDLIWLTISGATDHLYLATPYLTPPDEIVEALRAAVERGVRVEIVVPGSHTDTKLIQSATRSYYERLLKAGVHIYEYEPGRFHEKLLTADGHWSLIGSANMDNRSATLNVENIFGLEDRALAQELEKEFIRNREHATEVTLENFHPSLLKQAYYTLVALFAKQY